MRRATPRDVDLLVEMMAEFYGESAYTLNRERAAAAFRSLLSDDRLGSAWIVEANGDAAGYIVITMGYSMEFGGLDAVVDDFFIRPAHRGAGLGVATLTEVREICAKLGVRAMHLEVGRDNGAAQAVYRRVGFVETGRQLLTLRLADPAHVE